MRLYHAGPVIIQEPDIYCGRKNTDFGQGFYLTSDEEFAGRWAAGTRAEQTWINVYDLSLDGLQVRRLIRGREWFETLYGNRHFRPDPIQADVIIGPVANDTLYDTMGILTSGLIGPEKAMRLLMIGPVYEQVVIRTDRAVSQLTWISARKLSSEEARKLETRLRNEEKSYQREFASEMMKLDEEGI